MTNPHPAPSKATHSWCPRSGRPAGVPPAAITVYSCAPDEAAAFRVLAQRFGVLLTMTDMAASTDAVDLALGAECISVGHKTPISNATLEALSAAGVRYISARSIGVDHIDVEFASSVGISVEGISYSPDSVADYTLMLILMAVRHAKSVLSRAAANDYRLTSLRGRELRDLTIGVVGTGRIGTAVLGRLRGFGCRMLTHDIRPQPFTQHVPLETLLDQSDIVSLHTPLTTATHHLLDRRRIERLKRGAIVVNTGRGALVDTEALASALEEGRLGGAALDVLEGEEEVFHADRRDEPVGSDLLLRLQAMPNVVISPHTAFYTDHAVRDMVENTLVNCLNFEKGNQCA